MVLSKQTIWSAMDNKLSIFLRTSSSIRMQVEDSWNFFAPRKAIYSQRLDTKRWRKIFLYIIAVSVMVDPLYLYVPMIDLNKSCLGQRKSIKILATVVRTALDAIFASLIASQFLVTVSSSMSHAHDWKTRRRGLYVMGLITVFATLPLPQIGVWVIAPLMDGSTSRNTKKMVQVAVYSQFIPRFVLVYKLYKRVDSITPTRKSKTSVLINLCLYIYVGHLLGASWYLFSLETFFSCSKKEQFCDEVLSFSKINCSSSFDYGLYKDAYSSGILESENTLLIILYCFWWAIQNVSSLGQNLKPAKHVSEVCFAILIFACGLMLITLVVGLLQTRLLSATIESEEIKNKWRNVEQWMTKQRLPSHIKSCIREHEQQKQKETIGVDVAEFLRTIPKDLGRATKRHLGLAFLYKVPMFAKLKKPVMDAICDRLRPVLYTEQRYIINEGSLVDEMVFFTRGELLWQTKTGGPVGRTCGVLSAGDFCGEELLFWSLGDSLKGLPIATKTVQTVTIVEGFSLQPEDLKFVFTHFRVLRGGLPAQNFKYYSHEWRNWAAGYVQVAWRRHRGKFTSDLENPSYSHTVGPHSAHIQIYN